MRATSLLIVGLFPVSAAALDASVTIAGEIEPGVYGRVTIGTTPPPVFYPAPIVIVKSPKPVERRPIYLHVPPGHAKNWAKHCHRYDACGEPVYFVKSVEYEPGYKPKPKGKDHGPGKKDRDKKGNEKGNG